MTEIYCFICDNPVLGPEKAEYNALTALTKYSSTPVIEFVYKYVSADNFFGGKQYFCLECKERINRLDNLIEHQELLKQSIASDLANSVQKREDRTNVEHVEPEEEEVCLFTILEKDDDELEVEMSSEGTAEEPAEEEESTENNHSLVGVYKKCLRCNKHCTSKTEYRDHMKSHSSGEKANLICDICGCAYVSRSALNFHLKRHKDGGFRCTVCDRRFTQRGALNRHIAVHTGEKKYQCDICGKPFVHYSSFKMHQLTHSDVRAKKCEVCGLNLRSTSHLNRHMKIHSGEKPFTCPECGQKFAQRYNMMSHWRASHQGLPRIKKNSLSCPICQLVFPTKNKLEEHLLVVHQAIGNNGETKEELKMGNEDDELQIE